MNIQDALKETGKADQKNRCFDSYVKEDATGLLNWYFKKNDELRCITLLWDITDANWQPYHDKKEIIPKNAGELWSNDGGIGDTNYLTFFEDNTLKMITAYGSGNMRAMIGKDIIHNQNGWTRLYPPVHEEFNLEEVPGFIGGNVEDENKPFKRSTYYAVKPVKEALCLLNSMVYGGESHSSKSEEIFKIALIALELPDEEESSWW